MAADTTTPEQSDTDNSDANNSDSSDAPSPASDEVRYRLFYSAVWNVFFFGFGALAIYVVYDLVFNVQVHAWGWYEAAAFLGGIGVTFSCFFYLPTYQIELTDEGIRSSFYVGIGPLVLFRHERSAPWTHIFSVNHISFPLGWTMLRSNHDTGPLFVKYVSITIFVGMVHRRNAMRFIRKQVPNEVLDSEFKSIWGESLKEE